MECISTIKDVTLVAVALYTAWWARKTYAYKDKVAELKELLIVLEGINLEAFFHLQLTPIDGSKKTDLSDLLNLIFEFRTKVGSALYIDDEIRTDASDMSSFLEKELLLNITGMDEVAIDTAQRSFKKLHESLESAIKRQVKRYR
jgi:hypothetical protein